MRREEIDRLLARLSSGEITAGERAALFDAALADQELFEELFAEQALAEALADESLRDEFLIGESMREPELAASMPRMSEAEPLDAPAPEPPPAPRIRAERTSAKRTLPWWGWAVPAAVAASTILGVFLLRDTAPEPQVAQSVKDKPIEMAQSKPAQAPPPSAAVESLAEKTKRTPARADQPGLATPQPAVSAVPSAAVVGGAIAERSNEADSAKKVAGAPPPPPPSEIATIRGSQAKTEQLAAAGRAEGAAAPVQAESADFRSVEARKTVAQAAPAAAPAQNRAVADEMVRRDASASETSRLTAAKEAPVVVTAAALQVEDAGAWRDVAPGATVGRDRKLRLKFTAAQPGTWEFLSAVTKRTVRLDAGQTTYAALPAFPAGGHNIDVSFQPVPGTASQMRMRAAVGESKAQNRISFRVE